MDVNIDMDIGDIDKAVVYRLNTNTIIAAVICNDLLRPSNIVQCGIRDGSSSPRQVQSNIWPFICPTRFGLQFISQSRRGMSINLPRPLKNLPQNRWIHSNLEEGIANSEELAGIEALKHT